MVRYNGTSMGNTSLGDTLQLTRAACIADTKEQDNLATVECILTRLTSTEAAILTGRQYLYVSTDIVQINLSS